MVYVLNADLYSEIVDWAGGMESHTLIPVWNLSEEYRSWLKTHNVAYDYEVDDSTTSIVFENEADMLLFMMMFEL